MNKQAVISFESPLSGRLVKFAPEMAGSGFGSLASGIVPDANCVALRFVSSAPEPLKDVDVVTPVITTPSGNVGDSVPVLPFKLVTLKLDIRDLLFEVYQ